MNPTDVTPVSADWLVVESAVVAFEEAHRRHGRAAVADHCPPPAHPLHLAVLCELVRADLEFAWAAGVPRLVADYRADFPALFADRRALREVAFEEYRLRLQADESVRPAEYADRYGVDVSGWAAADRPPTEPMISPPPAEYDPAEQSGGLRRVRHDETDGERLPAPGDTFHGFRLVRELGRGAFARVFLAEQRALADRPVVLKVAEADGDEPQTLARLQHTNVVPVYSAHRVGRFQAVCMPHFGSATLADVLDDLRRTAARPHSGGELFSTVNRRADASVTGEPAERAEPSARPSPTPLARLNGMTFVDAVLWVGAELADGLAHAHDRGVLHRDLKPANVLVADDGRPMLLDFNLAVRTDGTAETVGGTPMYMPPEHLHALRTNLPQPTDPRSDLYSLGLILYELLTGRVTAVSSAGAVAARLAGLEAERSKPLPPARTLNPDVSPAASAVIARCLHPDPARRHPSAHHLRDDLRAHLDHHPLRHTPEPSLRERLSKFTRRNPWVKSAGFVGGVAAVLLLAAAVLVLVLVEQRNAAARTVAERQFRDELADHRLALGVPTDGRRTAAAVGRAQDTLSRYGLPGGDPAAKPQVKLTAAGPLAADVGDLHLLLAAAEANRDTPDRRDRAGGWIDLMEQTDRTSAGRKRAERFRELLSERGAADADADDPAALLVGRGEPRKVIALLAARPPAVLSPGQWQAKGECHTAVWEFAEAAACFTTALAVHARPNADLLCARGQAYLELKEHARAEADFDAALDLDPDAAHALVDRALARLGLGQPKAAVADLDRALELWPTHTRSYFIRADAKARSGDTAGAAADRKLGLAAEPGDPASWVARGMAKLTAADAAGAVADFDAALKLDPRDRDARQNKAGALADHQGKVADAVAVLDGLIADRPDDIPARAARGVYLARLKERDAAHADAAEVLKRNPPPLFRYQVAGIYALTSATHPKDADTAVKVLAAALHDRGGIEHLDSDPDLGPLRKDKRFVAVVEAVRRLNAPLAPPK